MTVKEVPVLLYFRQEHQRRRRRVGARKRSALSHRPFNSGQSRQKQRRRLRNLVRQLCQLLVQFRRILFRPSLHLPLEQRRRRLPIPLAIYLRRHQSLPLAALQLRQHRLSIPALPLAEAFRLHLSPLLGALMLLLWEQVEWEILPLIRRLIERRNEEVAATKTTVPMEDNRFLHPLQPFTLETRPQQRQRGLRRPWVALGRLLHH